jgi:hypothetical protein
MTLKLYKLNPNQITALQQLAKSDPANFEMPVSAGRAKSFSFQIEETNTVAKTLALADSRPVDWSVLDVGDELIEIETVWVATEGTVRVKKMCLQYKAHETIITDWTIEPSDLDLILYRAGYDADEFCETGANWEAYGSELTPALVVHYLTMPENETL